MRTLDKKKKLKSEGRVPLAQKAPALNAPIVEDRFRTVRPRPLHIEDKMRVLWAGRDPELEEIDNGAFAQWLRKTDEELAAGLDPGAIGSCQSQVVVVGHDFKPLPKFPTHRPATKPEMLAAASAVSAHEQANETIRVPTFRTADDPRTTPAGEERHAVGSPGGSTSGEAAYIRHQVPGEDEVEALVEYDLDEEDEAWMEEFNAKGKRGRISEDDFEYIMDRIEKARFAASEQRARMLGRSAAREAGHSTLPARLYPLERALRDLPEHGVQTLRAVHRYWSKKAAAAPGHSLLRRLGAEPAPGKHAASNSHDHGGESGGSESEDDEGVPFMGKEEELRGGHRRVMQVDEAHDKLYMIRDEVEQARTLAHQVLRREKLKKQLDLLWREARRAEFRRIEAARNPPRTAKNAAKRKSAAAAPRSGSGAGASARKSVGFSLPSAARPAAKKSRAAPVQEVAPMARLPTRHRSAGRSGAGGQDEPAGRPESESDAETDPLHTSGNHSPRSPLPDPEVLFRGRRKAATDLKPKASSRQPPAAAAPRSRAGRAVGSAAFAVEVPPRKRRKVASTDDSPAPLEAREAEGAEPRSLEAAEGPAPGIRRILRRTGSKPTGWVEYVATCKHGSARLDRIGKVVAFLAQHGGCRSEWAPLTRGKRESKAMHEVRLKGLFSFRRDQPAEDSSQEVAEEEVTPQQEGRRRRHSGVQNTAPGAQKRKQAIAEAEAQRERERREARVRAALKREGLVVSDADISGLQQGGEPNLAEKHRNGYDEDGISRAGSGSRVLAGLKTFMWEWSKRC